MWDQHTSKVNAGLIHCRKPFDPQLPSLLMIHGSGGYKELFRMQVNGLEGRVNAAAIDLPGHGDTPGPSMDRVPAYTAWLATFLEAGPVRPVVLGHSLGGAIALQIALDRPDLISGLICLGSGARLRVMPEILSGMKEDYVAHTKNGLAFSYSDKTDRKLVQQGIDRMLQVPPEVPIGDFTACDNFDVIPRLGEIKLPALALVGADDRLTPLKYSQFLVDKLPDCQLAIVEDAGHMASVEQPEAVTEAISRFMAGIKPAAV